MASDQRIPLQKLYVLSKFDEHSPELPDDVTKEEPRRSYKEEGGVPVGVFSKSCSCSKLGRVGISILSNRERQLAFAV